MNDLLFTQGQDNLAGIVGEMAVIAIDDILNLPALAAASALKTAVTDIVFKTGKKAAHLYITDETGKVDTKSVGNRDGKGRESVISGRYPAVGHALEDFISDCQNTPSIILYRLGRNGSINMIGVSRLDKTSTVLSTAIPAYFEDGASSTGEKRADQNGALLSWKYSAAHGPIEYAGSWANLFVAGA
jgi:hypothetical protein